MVNWLKTLPFGGMIVFTISPTLMGFTDLSLPKSSNNVSSQQISLQFPRGRDRSAPVTTGGGGTRGPGSGCLKTKNGELSLNVLTPNYSNVATTASATPTFYYYLPETSASLAEFMITDLNQAIVYQTTVKLPAQSGIMKIKAIPKIPLSGDQYYQWSLKIVCDSQHRDQDLILEGTLEYQNIDKTALSSDDPMKKAQFYAEKRIWLETLDSIAQIRSTSPKDWTELLQSVGLEGVSSQPFVEDVQSDTVNHLTTPGVTNSPKTPF
jgi:hypothetical protein